MANVWMYLILWGDTWAVVKMAQVGAQVGTLVVTLCIILMVLA